MKPYLVFKRVLDIFLSFFALLVLLPVFLIAFIGIKISSPGPVFYKANRIGREGRDFSMYKFRSMHVNDEKGHMITLRSDNRIFAFGAFLRKSKIDELPQLINILKGDMSIVGWRPEDKENVEQVFVNEYKDILMFKPGLTSPGSLYDYTHGELFPNEDDYVNVFLPQKMKLELFYVNNQSFFYDVKLVFRTIITIILIVFGKKRFNPPRELNEI